MTVNVTMTSADKSLGTLLGYVIHDEQRHYIDQCTCGEGDADHIYKSIYTLAKWLGMNEPSPKQLGREYACEQETAA